MCLFHIDINIITIIIILLNKVSFSFCSLQRFWKIFAAVLPYVYIHLLTLIYWIFITTHVMYMYIADI